MSGGRGGGGVRAGTKPKEYKQKSMKEKEKTKEDYEIQKARREVY